MRPQKSSQRGSNFRPTLVQNRPVIGTAIRTLTPFLKNKRPPSPNPAAIAWFRCVSPAPRAWKSGKPEPGDTMRTPQGSWGNQNSKFSSSDPKRPEDLVLLFNGPGSPHHLCNQSLPPICWHIPGTPWVSLCDNCRFFIKNIYFHNTCSCAVCVSKRIFRIFFCFPPPKKLRTF